MKICKIIIKGFQQFQDTELDFTHPKTGEPLNKICLIGQNGTGKSTILRLLNELLGSMRINPNRSQMFVALINTNSMGQIYAVCHQNILRISGNALLVSSKIDTYFPDWIDSLVRYSEYLIHDREKLFIYLEDFIFEQTGRKDLLFPMTRPETLKKEILFNASKGDIIIFSPPESSQNSYMSISTVPDTTLNSALDFYERFPVYHEVSKSTVSNMWENLVYLVSQREKEQREFELIPDNMDLTKRQLIEKFNADNPEVLSELSKIWNSILDRTNLEFDVESAKKPVHLSENLEAYIRLKHNGKQHIPYNQLSTGIRDFLFRIGHIYLLFYRREIRQAFLMVDEPENSLFPDFLFDLMELYQEIANPSESPNRTQMFFATHNPIVAAQFEPYERIILEWQEDGYVKAHKGKAPAGDDPNDVLRQDFELTSLMGKRGQEKWNEYLQLKKQARHEEDPEKKTKLINDALKIGSEYNFPAGSDPSRI